MKYFFLRMLPGALLMLSSFSCRVQHFAYFEETSSEITANPDLIEDQEIEKMLKPYRSKLELEMNEVLGIAKDRLSMGRPESTLGNWFADTQLKASEEKLGKDIDFAVSNSGGIRIPEIPKGPVTRGKIFELMPFDNMLVIMELSGEKTRELVNHIALSGGWPISKELRFRINKEGKAEDVFINGEPFDVTKKYVVSLSDYVANGGSDCSFLIGLPFENTGILIRDALIEQTKKDTTLEAIIDGRIIKN
jgi:2',3'-cyclic-nucleotide 2'-phosphodiesterase (5'-nucleotidase family)